jgi:hypothetical protein
MIRRGLASAFGCILLLGTSLAQSRPRESTDPSQGAPEFRRPGASQRYVQYGQPLPATLWEIVGDRYTGQAVRTRGVLSFADATSGYLKLTDQNSQVLVITVDEIRMEIASFVGLRVEVVGLARALKEDQGTCSFVGKQVPQSICDNPDLPALPDLGSTRAHWPRTSLTIWTITDVTPLAGRRREGDEPSATLRELLDGADTSVRERVSVRGRFCGRGLCGGLSAPAPRGDAWVLEQDGAAVWVVGRQPKGKGWRLDPSSTGDTSRWLEVVGRVQTCGGTRCLRADSVALVRSPDPLERQR